MIPLFINGSDMQLLFDAVVLGHTFDCKARQKQALVDVPGRVSGARDVTGVGSPACFERVQPTLEVVFYGRHRAERAEEFCRYVCCDESDVSFGDGFFRRGRLFFDSEERALDCIMLSFSGDFDPFRRSSALYEFGSGETFHARGDVETRGVARVSSISSATYVQITDVSSGKLVRVNSPSGTFSSQSITSITIDFEERHCEFVKSSGMTQSADAYVSLNSDYFAVKPGGNTWSVLPSSASVSLEVDELWL